MATAANTRRTRPTARSRGYFTPDEAVWRFGREWALMLGGPRALLLQAAHPLAVVGISEFSDYEENPWARLDRTMKAVWAVIYGTRAEADATVRRVRSVHKLVRGELAQAAGSYPAGTPYRADDPELLLWVHATLVDTALTVIPRYVRPLSEDDQQDYYLGMKRMAKLFGLPYSRQPRDLDAFRQYWQEQLASDGIRVTQPALGIAANVLNPKLPFGLPVRFGPAWEAVRFVTAGMMPRKLRDQYGLNWGRGRGALHAGSALGIRRFVTPLLPDMLRALRAARSAERAERLLQAA